jgi:hypothetical protein
LLLVSFSNAEIVSQADRNFVLSFDISNKTGAQPDIKYGVQLFQVTSKGVSKVDETVYDEVFVSRFKHYSKQKNRLCYFKFNPRW